MSRNRHEDLRRNIASFEPLEGRQLFSVELLASRSLQITGTDLADNITVDRDRHSTIYIVNDNGSETTWPVSQVDRIIINVFDGDDIVRVGLGGFTPTIRIPVFVDGGDGNDLLKTDGGNDTISGGAGDDTIAGFVGNDTIDCGDGNDLVTCNKGVDTVTCGDGDDQVTAEVSAKHLIADGGAGNDTLIGSSRNDRLIGGLGDDMIDGVRGKDFIDAGDGDDTIIMNFPRPKVTAGPGADTIFIPQRFVATIGKYVLDFTPGEDVVQ